MIFFQVPQLVKIWLCALTTVKLFPLFLRNINYIIIYCNLIRWIRVISQNNILIVRATRDRFIICAITKVIWNINSICWKELDNGTKIPKDGTENLSDDQVVAHRIFYVEYSYTVHWKPENLFRFLCIERHLVQTNIAEQRYDRHILKYFSK